MSGPRMWKAAVIGTGNIAQKVHLPFYKNSSRIQLVALCGRDAERAGAVASLFGSEHFFIDVGAMLQSGKPDVVSVCSPNNLHFTHVMQCLEAGCHVLCEKPPAVSLAQAKAMEMKAKEKGLLLAYNFPQRQLAEVQLVKEHLAQNFFGKVYHVKATFIRRRGIPGWGSFTNKEVQGGGALIDIGVHVLDLALHLLNYPSLNTALGSTYDYIGKGGGRGRLGEWDGNTFSVEDACFAHLQMAGGTSIALETAFALHTEAERQFSVQLFGEKGGGVLPPLKLFSDNRGEPVNAVCEYEQEENPQEKNMDAFLDACEGGVSNVCTAAEGTKLQGIIEAIYASSQTGKPG